MHATNNAESKKRRQGGGRSGHKCDCCQQITPLRQLKRLQALWVLFAATLDTMKAEAATAQSANFMGGLFCEDCLVVGWNAWCGSMRPGGVPQAEVAT